MLSILPHEVYFECWLVCSLIEEGIAGIFGPQSVGTTRAVQAICDLTEIPHIDTRWDTSSKFGKMNINFYPETKLLAKVKYVLLFILKLI